MTRAPFVVVLDYGFGNVRSAVRALERVGATVELSADRGLAEVADGLVVPGVGAFASVMGGLRNVRGDQIIERRLAGGRPVLGICVGMQVMFDSGSERDVHTEGLGQWPGVVERLPDKIVPHMGWNTLRPPEDSVLFDQLAEERFYFVHSYATQTFTLGADELADTRFISPRVTWSGDEGPFVAAVENGPLTATQFHPEKSGDAGAQLLSNWLATLR